MKQCEGFKYNIHGVCINAKPVLVHSVKARLSYMLEVAVNKNGWSYGFLYSCNSSLTGSGGRVCGVWQDGAGFATEDAAALVGAKYIKARFDRYLENVPQLRKQKKELIPLINFITQLKQKKSSMNNNFMSVSLNNIHIDPKQVRKTFNQTELDELTLSVAEKGILQPILVRTTETAGEYKLVCGERRVRAAMACNLTEVPAIIQTMTDDAAREAQLIENMQRSNVNPMEEAVAFKELLIVNRSVQDIAASVGKTEYYVRQRVKLCSLIKPWQTALLKGQIEVPRALDIALFEIDVQKGLWTDEGKESGKIDISTYDLQQRRANLTSATFDLNDASLVKKAGSCTACKFNSANAALFPDSSETAKCSKLPCYEHKTTIHFDKELEAAKEIPEMIFLNTEYSPEKSNFITMLATTGYTVLNGRSEGSFEPLRAPEMPDREDYDLEDYDNEEAIEHAFQEDKIKYAQLLNEYNENIAGGKYKKAFVVHGSEKGKYIYIKTKKANPSYHSSKGSSKVTKLKEDEGTLTADDVTAEIARIKERNKRAEEIDQNHVWAKVKSLFVPAKLVPEHLEPLSAVEIEAAAKTIFKKMGYSDTDKFAKMFAIDTKRGYLHNAKWNELSMGTLTQMIRYFFIAELPPAAIQRGFTGEVDTCIKLAGQYFPEQLKTIQLEAAEKAAKRLERVNKRINELNEKKKELKPVAKKAPAKKAAKKKAAKK